MKPISYWARELGLEPHPEGGLYVESYRSPGILAGGFEEYPAGRHHSTGIYFLLPGAAFSAFHRIRSDEMWHFYYGTPLDVIVLEADHKLVTRRLGLELELGERPQLVVQANAWFAARPASAEGYSLVGCTVAPGFDFRDFELADRERLSREYPEHTDIIAQLTRA